MSYSKSELVQMLKKYAFEHYEEDGFDVLVECYTDAEIEELIAGARTINGCIKKVKDELGPYNSYRKEIESTAF
jgi:hypothetical protein